MLLTTHKFKPIVKIKAKSGNKEPFFDYDSLLNMVQQLVIVFISAVLAMALTEHLENKSAKEHVQSFVAPMQDSCVTQFSRINQNLYAKHTKAEEGTALTNEELYELVDLVKTSDSTLCETMIYNENFISVLSPSSYMFLNDSIENIKIIRSDLKNISADNMDRQFVAESIAKYLFYYTDTIFSLEALKNDIEFNLLMFTISDDNLIKNNMWFKTYREDVKKLEIIFSADLKEYENKCRYNTGEYLATTDN